MPFPRPGVYSKRSWSLGRKIGAVLAFVIGGAVAGASGIMLFAPETPGAFALAPLPPRTEPAAPTVVAVVPETAPMPSVAKVDSIEACQPGSADCETEAKADRPAAVPGDHKPGSVQTATAPTQVEVANPATAVDAPQTAVPASVPPKSAADTELAADFMVPRPIASVAPILASAITAATVPAMFLASRSIASMSHPLVSPALPALAARPKPVVTTAVALPAAPAEATPPAAAPAKPRKTATRSQNNRRSNDNYYRNSRQNFFSFFWR